MLALGAFIEEVEIEIRNEVTTGVGVCEAHKPNVALNRQLKIDELACTAISRVTSLGLVVSFKRTVVD
jgi:hypothetical protein